MDEAVQSYTFNVTWHHGEPCWSDWMAAGFYDEGRQMVVQDCVREHRKEWNNGLESLAGFGCVPLEDRKVIHEESMQILRLGKVS